MNCGACGTENRPGRKFCASCGTALSLVVACPVCQAENEPSDRFCGDCGTTLGSAGPRDAPAESPTDGRVAERRLVTVLFADLVGFTPYSEGRDAEDVRAMLSRYFDVATGIVERYGGTVEKFIGDAVMAVWGVPAAHEDDAERAVRAALELVAEIPILDAALQARAGVLTGDVAVTIGARNEGMVAGDIVNTAARLQSAAQPGTVLVGESTYRAASTSIAFEPAGAQALKGKGAPVAAWHALRVLARRGGAGMSELPEPPFVGRDEELRLLKDGLEATARERRPRLLSITGPGGIGKSRLAWEFEKYVDGVAQDVAWHRGRCPAYGDGITFWALGEMIRRRAGLAEGDDEATTRERIAATVGEYLETAEDRAWVEPALLTLLGVEAPSVAREVLFAAWRIFFERIASRATTVLLFEDLQWADSGLLDFIDHLLEWSKGVPILVVTLARPELFDRRPGWGTGTRNLTQLALGPLTDQAIRELLAGFVPGLTGEPVDRIVARAEGVPLYAVEMIRSLVADGRLEPADGAYRPTADLGELAVPDTLRSLIASRLDALDAMDRALMQDASVLGQVFTLRGIAAASGRPEAELEARLRTLIRRQLLELEADPRSPERGQYRFVQSLIREVAYGTLAKADRRARHLAVARFFESLGDDELAGALANHYLAAHQASASGPEADAIAIQARIALRAAGQRAAALGAQTQAVSFYRQALEVAGEPVERLPILIDAATSANAATDYPVALGFLEDANQIAQAVRDDRAAGRVEALVARSLIDSGRIVDAIPRIEAALTTLAEGDDVARAELLTQLSRALFRNDDPARAVQVVDQALVIAERLNLDDLIADAFTNKAASLRYLGRRREAIAIGEAAVRIAHERGLSHVQIRAINNLAGVVSETEGRRGTEIAREGLRLAQQVGNRGMANWLAWNVATDEFDQGDDWDDPMAELEELLALPLDPLSEHRTLFAWLLFGVSRQDPRVADRFSRLAALTPVIGDPGAFAAEEAMRGWLALADGDLNRAHAAWMRASDLVVTVTEFAAPWAIRAATWARDVSRIRAATEQLAATSFSGPFTRATIDTGRAALAALEGRHAEAVQGFRSVLQVLADGQFHFIWAATAVDFVVAVGPGEPQAGAAADEARIILERVGARLFLDRLDLALAQGGPADRRSTTGREARARSS